MPSRFRHLLAGEEVGLGWVGLGFNEVGLAWVLFCVGGVRFG